MAEPGRTEPAGARRGAEEPSGCWSRAGVGCVTLVAGAASGGMIGVTIGEIVGFFSHVPDCPGLPVSCTWGTYMLWGVVVGAVTLPALALWRLGRSGRRDGQSDRG